MKTLLKDQHSYWICIGFLNNNHESKDINEDEGKKDGSDGDDWEDMYMKSLDGNSRGSEDGNEGRDSSESRSEDKDGNGGKDINSEMVGCN